MITGDVVMALHDGEVVAAARSRRAEEFFDRYFGGCAISVRLTIEEAEHLIGVVEQAGLDVEWS